MTGTSAYRDKAGAKKRDLSVQQDWIKLISQLAGTQEVLPAKLRVLHGTMEIANQMRTMTQGLQQVGLFAKVLCYYQSYLNYQSDYSLVLQRDQDFQQIHQKLMQLTEELLPDTTSFISTSVPASRLTTLIWKGSG